MEKIRKKRSNEMKRPLSGLQQDKCLLNNDTLAKV